RFHVNDLEQQQRVVCGECTAGLADHVRHGQLVLPAGLRNRIDHVVCVLLQRVVHACHRRGVRTVVIHAQAAANINVGNVNTQCTKLCVEPRDFLKSALDVADVSDLAAKVEVDELQDVQPSEIAQAIHEHHQLGRAQAELGALTTRLGPASEAGRCELDSDTRGGRYAHFIRDLQQYVDRK